MRPQQHLKMHIALVFLFVSALFSSDCSFADSFIRIIGDKTPAHNDSTIPATTSQPSSSAGSSTTIRIIGDKSPPPASQAITPDESLSKETAKQLLSQRLATQKAEEERKELEKQEQERLAIEKAELLKEATRQAAIKREQEEQDTRKAEEIRIAAEKAEQERVAQLKAEQEKETARKAEEQRIATEKAEQERVAQHKAEQEKETARLAAIKRELEEQDARKTEEMRIAAEKAKQATRTTEESRIAAEKAELERMVQYKTEQENEAARQSAILHLQKELDAGKTDDLHKTAGNTGEERTNTLEFAVQVAPGNATNATEKQQPQAILSQQQPNTTTDSNNSPSTSVHRYDPGTTPSSTSQEAASIWDLYLSAKSNDPALGRTQARVTGSKAESDIVFSSLLPHLNSSAGVKQISQTLTGYGSASSSNNYTALNYNATAQLTLLHVPTLYSLSAAAAGLSGEQAGVIAARQNLIVKFTDSYFTLLKAQTDKQIALGEINRLKQVLDQSQAFLKAGTGDIISVYEAQSRLDSANADLAKSESSLRLAEQKLFSLVGKPITDVVNYLPKQPAGPDPDDLAWWVATMEKEQPAIRQAHAGVTQATEQRKSAKSEYLPILQASGGYDVNRGTAALPTAEVKQWFVGATLTLPLYSGGETSAKVRRATASEEERRHAFEETMDQQRENLKQAFFNLRYNISMIKALDQKKASAEIQLAAVKKGRKIGTRNAIDVLNAEQGYSIALRDYRYALYDNIIRVIQLKSAAGILAEADVSKLSEMEAAPPASGLNLIISMAAKPSI